MDIHPAEPPPVTVGFIWGMDLTVFTLPSYHSQQGADRWEFQKLGEGLRSPFYVPVEKAKCCFNQEAFFFFLRRRDFIYRSGMISV